MILKLHNDMNTSEKEITQIMTNIEKLRAHPNESEMDISSLGEVSEECLLDT